MKILPIVALLALACSASQAQQKLVPAQSEISFIVKQMGVPLDGKFGKFDGQVGFDPAKPEAGKINLSIDLSTAVVGDADTVKELKKAEWFGIAKFPTASFTSTGIKAAGAGKFDVTGNLSIKGISKPLSIPVTLTKAGAVSVAQGSFTIKRGDFKIGEGDWADTSIVAGDVQVKFKLAVTGL